MTAGYITFDDTLKHSLQLKKALKSLKDGRDDLNDLISIMTQMIDGDGSSVTQFTLVTTKFGFNDNTAAKAAWDEINSAMSKLNTNASVSNVLAAMNQMFGKLS